MGRVENNVTILITCVLFLSACHNEQIKVSYYDNSKQIKEQLDFFSLEDSSSYKYTSYYLNGQMKNQGRVVRFKKEGVWSEWYGDGILRREIEYIQDVPNMYAENRKLPEIIFHSDSLIVGVETKIRVLNIYPNEDLPTSVFKIRSLPEDAYYDFAIIPLSTDSLYFFYFSPFLFNEEESGLKKNKMIIISKKPVYEKD